MMRPFVGVGVQRKRWFSRFGVEGWPNQMAYGTLDSAAIFNKPPHQITPRLLSQMWRYPSADK